MSGILYLCGTPLGNLEDMTPRAVRILKEVDLIACEDTRHTLKLLNYFGIKAELTSYHEHNKSEKGRALVKLLLAGKNVALVSDAGMPVISDPGEELVRICYENEITVTVVPGASAATAALALSGMNARRFIFEGFMPLDNKERRLILDSLREERRTAVFYEAPHHLLKTLREMYSALGDRRVAVVRELTKKYEEVLRGGLAEVLEYFERNAPKGEFVVVVEGISDARAKELKRAEWESLTPREHVAMYENAGIERKEAIKRAAADRGVAKSVVYGAVNREE